MKLLIALCASLLLEALTYHSSIDHLSSNLSFAFGITLPQSAIISTAIIAFIKLVIVCVCIDTTKTKSNLLIVLLAMCALFDCFLITLFLNTSLYAMLFNISEMFSDVYRAVEVVCIVSLIVDVICILFSNTAVSSAGRNRNKTRGDIRMGDKI
jgi:hypothetical protein